MFQEFFAQSGLLIWPLIGLVFFVLSFAGVLLYVGIGLRDRQKVARLAQLPLQDETIATEAASDRRGDRDE